MNEADALQAIKEALAAKSPEGGDWSFDPESLWISEARNDDYASRVICKIHEQGDEHPRNAHLIVTLRNLVPQLVARLEGEREAGKRDAFERLTETWENVLAALGRTHAEMRAAEAEKPERPASAMVLEYIRELADREHRARQALERIGHIIKMHNLRIVLSAVEARIQAIVNETLNDQSS